ncbi:hypothetical protein [Burkholderia ubonensis]|uniref:hypothetical protein n=1 Tax=Burkholderia ubonensis TaxID=101571 RepID=UPI0012F7E244|nr:hypothetical protein [Burkholderia ubonensis]
MNILLVGDDPKLHSRGQPILESAQYKCTQIPAMEGTLLSEIGLETRVIILSFLRTTALRKNLAALAKTTELKYPIICISRTLDDELTAHLLFEGADDCMKWPKSDQLFLAKINALARRLKNQPRLTKLHYRTPTSRNK